jgi:flagellar biosynthetic protein FliR
LSRVGAFVAFFPLFAGRYLPHIVKAGLAIALTVFWMGTPTVHGLDDIKVAELPTITAFVLIGQEVGIGILLALTLGVFLIPARIAGAYVGQEIGLSLAAVSDPGSVDSSTLVTKTFEAFAVMVFFACNFHHFLILLLHVSFRELSGKINLLKLPTELLVSVTQLVCDYGLLIIAPIGICLFLLTVGIAFLNKAAPTLNLFSVGMTVRSGIGIFCLLAFSPVIFQAIHLYFCRTQRDIEQIFAAFQ